MEHDLSRVEGRDVAVVVRVGAVPLDVALDVDRLGLGFQNSRRPNMLTTLAATFLSSLDHCLKKRNSSSRDICVGRLCRG